MDGTPFSFVDYLNRYCTTSAKHEAAFDEYVAGAPEPPAGPLRLDTSVESFIFQRFQEEDPPSIILTGNAGDGKTYLGRRVIQAFSKRDFQGWGSSLDQEIPRGQRTLRVVKDLSEVDEDRGSQYLSMLANSFRSDSPDNIFLIAANEGRLRRLLLGPDRRDLRHEVDRQLEQGPDAQGNLVVINLNRIATSLRIPQTLAWLTDERNWPDITEGSIGENPIHHNVLALRDRHVAGRIQLLYRLLERLGNHITIRDMLIHLAFVLTGGRSSRELLALPVQKRRAYAYYENFVGETASQVFRERSSVLRMLTPLRFGEFSCYELDDFIVNGHEEGHPHHGDYQSLFKESIDLGTRFFSQERDAYLHGSETAYGAAKRFLSTLPSLRRKAFFEWQAGATGSLTNQLIFLERFTEFEELLEDSLRHDEVKRLLILGLNRAFSGLYLEDETHLLLTSQYTNKVAISVPIVMANLPSENIELRVESVNSNVVDLLGARLVLTVYPPPNIGAEASAVHWELDLLTYEYLIRRALGGTPDVLSDECALEIRMFKDRLTQQIVNNIRPSDRIEFIGPEKNGYRRFQVRLQGEDRIVVKPA